ncbi:MAG: Mu-like prophage major head subunit gpT family protein [Pseudomonadota bacterium]
MSRASAPRGANLFAAGRGFTETCFDGQPFFDEAHPLTDRDGKDVAVSNMQDGAGEPSYLLETSRAVRPIVWRESEAYTFTQKTAETDDNVFKNSEYLFGLRARVNAGFGLWQLGFGSHETLNAANYFVACSVIMEFFRDHGRILGIKATTLVVPPSLEDAAIHLLNTETVEGGGSNPWKATADLIVTPFVMA